MKKCILIVVSLLLAFSFSFTVFAAYRSTENKAVTETVVAVKNEENKTEALPVEIKAKSVVLMEVTSGKILLEHNCDERLYPASVTKIMTMLLVSEAINEKKITLADSVVCSENAASKGGSQIWLEPGESMTVDELLRATAIGSANDAATLLGEYVSGSETAFVSRMNERAKELGMKNTYFENATGLDDTSEKHLTTARDIGIMSCELLKYDFIKDYTSVWMDSLRNGETELVNTNKLVRFYEGTTGLKTGTTSKAGCCISASAKRDNLHLVAVVMGSENSNDRFETAKTLLNWGFSNYKLYELTPDKNDFAKIPVEGGKTDFVYPMIPELSPILAEKGMENAISIKVKCHKLLQAPVTKSQVVGEVIVKVDGKEYMRENILAKDGVEKLTFFDCFMKIVSYLCRGEEK